MNDQITQAMNKAQSTFVPNIACSGTYTPMINNHNGVSTPAIDYKHIGMQCTLGVDLLDNEEIGRLIHDINKGFKSIADREAFSKEGWRVFEDMQDDLRKLTGYNPDNSD